MWKGTEGTDRPVPIYNKRKSEPMSDHILEELWRIREEHAKQFNYDLDAMWERSHTRQYHGRPKVATGIAGRRFMRQAQE